MGLTDNIRFQTCFLQKMRNEEEVSCCGERELAQRKKEERERRGGNAKGKNIEALLGRGRRVTRCDKI